MTKRQIASLVIKLMGVFILLKSIAYTPAAFSGIFSAVRSHDGAGLLQTIFAMMMFSLAAMIPIAWSLCVILLSDKAAAWIIKEDVPLEHPQPPVSKEEIMTVAVSCIGLFFIIAAIPSVIGGLINGFSVINRQTATWFAGPYRMINIFRQLIVPAIQIGLGIWLFIGSKGIVKLWKKIRS